MGVVYVLGVLVLLYNLVAFQYERSVDLYLDQLFLRHDTVSAAHAEASR